MNLTLTVHLRIQFSDTAALKYQGGKEGLWPSKSWSWKGRFPYFRTAFWLFCGFSFSETPVRHMFAGYRRLMKHIKMMMVQQRMSSRMMLLPIPSVSRNSYKQTGIRQGRGIKLVSTWLFIYYSKVIPCKIEDLPDTFVTSNYFFRSSQKTTNYFYWTWIVFLVGKQMLKKSQLNKKNPTWPDWVRFLLLAVRYRFLVQIYISVQIWSFFIPFSISPIISNFIVS